MRGRKIVMALVAAATLAAPSTAGANLNAWSPWKAAGGGAGIAAKGACNVEYRTFIQTDEKVRISVRTSNYACRVSFYAGYTPKNEVWAQRFGDGPDAWSQLVTKTTPKKVDRTKPIFLATWIKIPAFNNYVEVVSDRLVYL
jgi:hypothetical protein